MSAGALGRSAQGGAVLLLGVLLLASLSMGLLAYFYLSLLTGHKMRQQYANDAAAYSAAVVQARALNLLSYVNRAHLAHQVALAHLITMASWHQSGLHQQSRLRRANPPVHLLALFFGPEAAWSYQASLALHESDQHALLNAIGQHQGLVQHSLKQLQDDILDRLPAEREHIVEQVIATNFPELSVTDWQAQIHTDAWPTAFQLRPTASLASRHSLEYLQSLYGFLQSRDAQQRSLWIVDERCPWRRHELRRRGRTVLDDQARWSASDTQSLHALRANRWIACYSREYPLAWAWITGGAQTSFTEAYSAQAPADFSDQSFWSWVKDYTTWDIFTGQENALANSWAVRDHVLFSADPMPDLWQLREPTPLAFSVSLRMRGPANQWVSTHSAGETYYRRPPGAQIAVLETAHLFQAYWLARLSALALEASL